FAELPRFSPEIFARLRSKDALKRKQLEKGLLQLSQEGAIQVFALRDGGLRDPILGAVGALQLEVLQYRLSHEYGAEIALDRLPYTVARWIQGTGFDPSSFEQEVDALCVVDRDQDPLRATARESRQKPCRRLAGDRMDRRFTILALLAAAALAPACRSSDPRASDGRRIFRLGYLPNVTHAPALWGLESGAIGSALGPSVVLEARAFNAGPAVIEALFASDLDAAWVGPNPAINGFQRSHGKALRIVAFSVANGAQLVVRPQIGSARDLARRKIASPALG